MDKGRDIFLDKGASTCPEGEVMSLGDARNSCWSVVRYNANNAWYVNLNNGNMNNNNVNNRYVGAGVSELSENINEILEAERLCYLNKHDSLDATRTHYHIAAINKLAESLHNATWKQGRAYVFACTYPTIREIWAAFYTDRIVHHLIAPTLVSACEKVHIANGDVSHGNRTGHSADTACRQILANMQLFPNGYVGKRDLSGFFMSIDRKRAYEIAEEAIGESKYLPLMKQLILHDPTKNCEVRSDAELMARIPTNKSLFHAQEGRGLPIGNFYSQLVANLYLKDVDSLHLSSKWRGKIGYTRFVDDMCVIADSPKTINDFFTDVEAKVQELGCKVHPYKRYLQPIGNGVSFCGRTVKPHGIYINNRIVHAIKRAIAETPATGEGASMIVRSINSYFGFLSHCKAYKIQQAFAKDICAKWHGYLHYVHRGNQLVFSVNYKYTNKSLVLRTARTLNAHINETNQTYQRLFRPQGCRRSANARVSQGRVRTCSDNRQSVS